MRKHAEWLNQSDERILEFLSEFGNHPPTAIRNRLSEIGEALEYHPNYIQSRCRELQDYGLLVNVGGGTYSVTDAGEQFLNGDLDAATLDDG